MIPLQDKNVLVVGLGRSGLAAARIAALRGARVTVTDKRDAPALRDAISKLPPGVTQQLGGHEESTFLAADMIVLSPGVPHLPELDAAARAGVWITGEMEFASRFIQGTLVAITGTNGKSTTTTLCGAIVKASGYSTFVGGNLGDPIGEAVGTRAAEPGGILVIEASSFQLETVEQFHPRVAVLLNVTPDHLDRYRDFDAYAAAKAKIFAAQGASDFAVVNADDAIARRCAEATAARKIFFSTSTKRQEGGWLESEALCVRLPGGDIERYPTNNPSLVGRHNHENALAALLAGRLAGATPSEARRSLLEFRALAHRMELVAEARGVEYYDDSKGTNVGAVTAALSGFPRPIVLIAGGRDKGGDYAPLAEVFARVGRSVVLIGEAADRIAASFRLTVGEEKI
ncbi:MAG: UDP-N-acetylmuramoyl-L-alanine--D-glutamate ligase, partial [Deltaproteobacteria bacterium]|nr:UDP-N-acetylmuramoyl-L-alanine--D-glutamate ligase [Deltaproteobacteria bacterium]